MVFPQSLGATVLLILAVLTFGQTNALPEPKPFMTIHAKNWKHQNTVDVTALLRGGNQGTVPTLLKATQRGGAEIDKSETVSMSDISPMDVFYVAINGALLATIVFFCRKMTRTGGRAPSWITNWIEDPQATGLLHLGYFGLGALLRLILPPGLARVIFSPPSVALLGTVFPAVESVRAAVTDSGSDDRTWLMYWVVHGIFQYSTEFIDQLALEYEIVYKFWHTFEVLAILWLVMPFTDGATLIYKTLAQPYLLPFVAPIKNAADGWIAGLALTTINASYIWWFSFIFMQLPITVKRYAVMAVGSILPVASTIVALASTADNSEMRWLTYWPCFSLLFVTMIGVEKFVGSFKGLYVMTLAATLYLMLPMFDGSMKVFRSILVPWCGQQELLIIRDAHLLAGQLLKKIPVDRQDFARQQAANAFVSADAQ